MTSRREWQLQQLGITRWSLCRPTVLQGEIAITLPAHIRLVMVADELPAMTEPLLLDIFRAMTVSPDCVLQLTPERVMMLPEESQCLSWRLGVTQVLSLQGTQLASPSFYKLQHSGAARAALWRQIYDHEYDFFTHAD